MIYLRAWANDGEDTPVLLYIEMDEAGWEKRKVDFFRCGMAAYADESEEIGEIRIGEFPMPPLDEIAADPDCELYLISQEEFEVVWRDAKLGRWPIKPPR